MGFIPPPPTTTTQTHQHPSVHWYFLNNGHYKNTKHIKLTLTIEIVPPLYQCPMS